MRILKLLSTTCLLFLSSWVFAQQSNTDAFGKGTNVLSAGLGFGGDYTYIGGGYTSTPNFIISYDNGTFNNVGPGIISLGGIISYKSSSYDYMNPYTNYYYDQKWTYFIIGFRSAYHWNFTTNSKFDPYAGLMLAYYDIGYKSSSNDPYYTNPANPYYFYSINNYNSYLAFSLYIGARYFVSNNIAVWLELGFGYSNAALGVSYKF